MRTRGERIERREIRPGADVGRRHWHPFGPFLLSGGRIRSGENRWKGPEKEKRKTNGFFDLDLVDLQTIQLGREFLVEGKLVVVVDLSSQGVLGDHTHFSTGQRLESALQILFFDLSGLFDLLVSEDWLLVELEQHDGLQERY
jgi:hypothetical protein